MGSPQEATIREGISQRKDTDLGDGWRERAKYSCPDASAFPHIEEVQKELNEGKNANVTLFSCFYSGEGKQPLEAVGLAQHWVHLKT